jgi:hypothetical protein
MNALLVILGLALLFYAVHRIHEGIGGCGTHGDDQPAARRRPGFTAGLLVVLLLLLPLMVPHVAAPPGSRLGTMSFSERILAARPANLAVLPVTGAQWSDWGRPQSVLETLARLGTQPQWAGRVARLA